MDHFHLTRCIRAAAAAAVIVSLLPAGAFAGTAGEETTVTEAPAAGAAEATEAAEAEEGPNTGAISITFDNTFTTAYFFRGYMNIRDGFIWQPSLEVSLNLFESEDGILRSADVGVGVWNSYQSNDIGGKFGRVRGTDGLYETDWYPSLSLTWAGGITSAVTYYFYTSPNDSFSTVQEVTLDLSYDDSELLGAFSLSPTATFAFETDRSSVVSSTFEGKGSVVVLGIEPGYTFNEDGDYSVALTLPVTLALSMDEYYIGDTPSGVRNDTFGYATIGLHASVPISCIPPRFGEWSVNNGFDVFFLDDVLEEVNQGDAIYPVWTSSITLDY